MTNIDGSLVLVTGATGGFGAHMVEQFHAAGARLIVTDSDRATVAVLEEEYTKKAGPTGAGIAAAFGVDLATAGGCLELFDFVNGKGFVPDILINNAGIAVAGRLDHVPLDRWEKLMQVNLLAPMRLCALFVPRMISRGSGHIVNISSLAGWVGAPNLAPYCASKFGLRGFSEGLSSDLAQHNVRVSAVYPSFSKTPILDSDQFGFDQKRTVPEEMLSDPADIVAKIIAGISRDKAQIFPDSASRIIHYLARYMPAAIPILQRRMERAMQQASGQ